MHRIERLTRRGKRNSALADNPKQEMRALIRFKHSGDFKNTEGLFRKAKERSYLRVLEKYGKAGVEALASTTPSESGKTAASWDYEIVQKGNGYSIYWTNSNVNDGVNIALILQYGHETGTGGYVQGIDYVNPAIRPIFDSMANEVWKEVTS